MLRRSWLLLLVACGMSRLPAPPYTRHPTEALTPIPYPPPPAHIESIPEKPASDAVWIDGEWTWSARRWAWKPGRWVRPIPGAAFAPWTVVRDPAGALYMASGVWRDKTGRTLEDPNALAAGQPSVTTVLDPEGAGVSPTPVVRYDGGAMTDEGGAP